MGGILSPTTPPALSLHPSSPPWPLSTSPISLLVSTFQEEECEGLCFLFQRCKCLVFHLIADQSIDAESKHFHECICPTLQGSWRILWTWGTLVYFLTLSFGSIHSFDKHFLTVCPAELYTGNCSPEVFRVWGWRYELGDNTLQSVINVFQSVGRVRTLEAQTFLGFPESFLKELKSKLKSESKEELATHWKWWGRLSRSAEAFCGGLWLGHRIQCTEAEMRVKKRFQMTGSHSADSKIQWTAEKECPLPK